MYQRFIFEKFKIYNWLLVHSKWSEEIPSLNATILCPGGEWRQGIVVALADGLAVRYSRINFNTSIVKMCPRPQEEGKIYSTLYAPENDLDTLQKCLLETNLIDWGRMKHFSGVLERFVPILADVLKSKNFKHTDDFQYSGFLNYIPLSEAENQPLPE